MNREYKKLLSQIVLTPGLISYDLNGPGIKVKKGRFSPIYINMKKIWSYPEILSNITKRLKEKCVGCNCVIGIEAGGSPFASVIAKELEVSLVLTRKKPKNANIFAGDPITGGGSVVIIDDVLATGFSMEKSLENIRKVNRKVALVVILSYGMDKIIAKKYDLTVHSLYQIEDFIQALPLEQVKMLAPYIKIYQKKLLELLK
ncbi:MAG: hypothetical protein A3D35_03125 [Candidatus Staskawiczbacteria bacterium RIFCSPHIGHO2_02_FULL_34_9]|uniref:Phosphoribosyltransferase domain-containing protein n=1 Tax=Candidatus Staskawiczbacteria bacterium RIFCSPHIGHO2_02_FULL_34_9 TaxID=1802206 RepID=A0A1G2HZK1_9BACT|nr:MAG: hypothetical protein A3D35_03125 [Candidatus Staskawiczbacteria bacterium RIFCSPHIGHO2_02_FULL_34_9]